VRVQPVKWNPSTQGQGETPLKIYSEQMISRKYLEMYSICRSNM